MQILNGLVYLDSFEFEKTHLFIEGPYIHTLSKQLPTEDTIATIHSINSSNMIHPIDQSTMITSPNDSIIIDATDCYVIPGLIDIHLHGACGHDFCDSSLKAIEQIVQYELQNGITTIFPTTMTLHPDKICGILKSIAHYAHTTTGSMIGGIHLEGPYISPKQCGAQDAQFCQSPDIIAFWQFQKAACGLIRYVTLAPELDRALDFIQTFSHEVILSLGHTAADYETSLKAFKSGVSHITHCYNAMPPLHHRAPGVIGAAMDYEKAYIELICDGLHLHPTTIRQSFKLFDSDHIILISDSTMATGLPDGDYTLGGAPIKVTKGEARTIQGNLAGSTTHLMDCFRQAISFGVPLEIALKCVTANPAREAGLYAKIGSLTPGKHADCVILNQSLEIVHVIKNGQLIL